MNRNVEKERNKDVVVRDILGVYFSLPFLKVLSVIPSWVCVRVCTLSEQGMVSLQSLWVLLV